MDTSLSQLGELITLSREYITAVRAEQARGESLWYEGASQYLDKLAQEIDEARAECRDNNAVYLGDECGDLLWIVVSMLNALAQEGKIDSIDDVINRAVHKYTQRVAGHMEGRSRSYHKTAQ